MMPSMASTLPGATESDCRATKLARRHALERGIDGGEQNRRPVAALDARQPRQRGHALRDEAGMRRDPVIGQAIPGRKLQHRQIGREEVERAGERRHARPVAADDQEAGRRRIGARCHRAGEIGDDEAFGAVGDACQGERAAGAEQLGGTARHASPRALAAPIEIAQPPEQCACR